MVETELHDALHDAISCRIYTEGLIQQVTYFFSLLWIIVSSALMITLELPWKSHQSNVGKKIMMVALLSLTSIGVIVAGGQFYVFLLSLIVTFSMLAFAIVLQGSTCRPNARKQITRAALVIFTFIAMIIHFESNSVVCGCDFNSDPSGCAKACSYNPYTLKYFYGYFGIKPA